MGEGGIRSKNEVSGISLLQLQSDALTIINKFGENVILK